MKTLLPTFLLLLSLVALPTHAQAPSEDFSPAQQPAAVPNWLYCEIICFHLPVTGGRNVIFDFGQKTAFWRYEVLTDSEERAYQFESGIQALNYMTGRGWEFVQAYTSGEKNTQTHFLLRIATDKLPEEAVQSALTLPRSKKGGAAWKEEADK